MLLLALISTSELSGHKTLVSNTWNTFVLFPCLMSVYSSTPVRILNVPLPLSVSQLLSLYQITWEERRELGPVSQVVARD